MSYSQTPQMPGYPGAATYPGMSAPPPPGGQYPPQAHGSPMPPIPAYPPVPGPPAIGGATNIPTNGVCEGAQYRIDHRDSNSMLYVRLQPEYELKAKPGSMVAMDASVRIKGKLKFSMKKMFTGAEMSESIFTGPGEVMIAPEVWGDIVPLQLDGQTAWCIGKDAFLAATRGITRTTKSQGIGKALFSGEGLFVYHATGTGVIFLTSLGAIVSRTLQPGEQWIVDNGHLVAWTAQYKVERIDAGGFLSGSHTDEGLVCRFTGPGIVYIQTRNPETLGNWIAHQVPENRGS
ncbi:hypothetical protein A0H81_09032 [Grifola frondosa]|uniref:Altered inheritance of mitochondria protein 24, mitochondrial n=1 Tax=Grifola frondosa TaxID=5627 RepID=A0A1C7M1Y1_GRIFR|nr:hypothetical protein A0H81_09032 [Grifola frondosa]